MNETLHACLRPQINHISFHITKQNAQAVFHTVHAPTTSKFGCDVSEKCISRKSRTGKSAVRSAACWHVSVRKRSDESDAAATNIGCLHSACLLLYASYYTRRKRDRATKEDDVSTVCVLYSTSLMAQVRLHHAIVCPISSRTGVPYAKASLRHAADVLSFVSFFSFDSYLISSTAPALSTPCEWIVLHYSTLRHLHKGRRVRSSHSIRLEKRRSQE